MDGDGDADVESAPSGILRRRATHGHGSRAQGHSAQPAGLSRDDGGLRHGCDDARRHGRRWSADRRQPLERVLVPGRVCRHGGDSHCDVSGAGSPRGSTRAGRRHSTDGDAHRCGAAGDAESDRLSARGRVRCVQRRHDARRISASASASAGADDAGRWQSVRQDARRGDYADRPDHPDQAVGPHCHRDIAWAGEALLAGRSRGGILRSVRCRTVPRRWRAFPSSHRNRGSSCCSARITGCPACSSSPSARRSTRCSFRWSALHERAPVAPPSRDLPCASRFALPRPLPHSC